jgi:hypothetical protein
MKLFDVDWVTVLRELSRWSTLERPARRLVLDELKLHGYVPVQRFGVHLESILASQIPQIDAQRRRVWVGDRERPLLKVLRAMDRHPVFDSPKVETLIKYLEDHFTSAEIERLGRAAFGGRVGYTPRQLVASRLASAAWLEGLLEARGASALLAWGEARGWDPLSTAAGSRPVATLEALQGLVRQLTSSPSGVPLAQLAAKRRDNAVPEFVGALHTGLATGVLFAGMRGTDLEPMMGVWPEAARELTRPAAAKPHAVVPVEKFSFAVGMEDMTTLLATVVAAPVRLRADDLAVFARARAAIEQRLVPLPRWAAHLFTNDQLPRVDEAARELELHRFVQVRGYDGNPHLTTTPKGQRWLEFRPGERLASLVDPIRNAKDENPRGAYDVNYAESFFPFVLPFFQVPKSLRLRHELTSAFLGVGSAFIPLEGFLDHAAREANPLLELSRSAAAGALAFTYYAGSADPRQSLRDLWRNMLAQFLIVRLLRLGGASVGRLETGELCFALTDVGRYLFGQADAFEYGSNAVADVVVQPNFEIVFLGSAPAAEAVIARFAERAGATPGIAFRITRASVLAAAEAGMTADNMLGELKAASSKPIPKNVEKEIIGWMSSVRRARLRRLEVIECDNDETAARIVDLLGPKVSRLTATMIELPAPTPSARAATIKRLRASGVFLDAAESARE